MESKLTILEMSYRQNGENSSVICSKGLTIAKTNFYQKFLIDFFFLFQFLIRTKFLSKLNGIISICFHWWNFPRRYSIPAVPSSVTTYNYPMNGCERDYKTSGANFYQKKNK